MGLKIMTTGLEQYAPGGTARVKTMIIGGPGVGKTRSASYWPKPIYADCEGGLSSIADRGMPFVTIKSSQDMLDFLEEMKREERRPESERRWLTVVIDTLDAFQRKVKDEWLQAHPGAQSFGGFDAWGYLDAKMQMLMTRLLNLDMNVYVAVHYTDKTITEGQGENQKTRQEFQLQLSGAIKDQVFNDFDLVGWMGKYYEAVEGQRVEKRGLTFKSTPDKPFLKDRLNVTPTWLEITFSDEDYTNLWTGLIDRLDEFKESQCVGEIESATVEPGPDVVAPDAIGDATLPPVDPKEVPLTQWDRPTLAKMCKDEGVTTLPDGTPIKSNTLKGEYIKALEHHRAQKAAEQVPANLEAEAPAAPVETPAETPGETVETPTEPAAETETVVSDGVTLEVNTSTGEAKEVTATPEEAVATIESTLGGEVVATEEPAPAPVEEAPAPVEEAKPAAESSAGKICEDCGKSLADEKPDYVRLGWIKYRKNICEADYQRRKAGN